MSWGSAGRVAASLVALCCACASAGLAGCSSGKSAGEPEPTAGPPSVPDLAGLGWIPVLEDDFDGDALDERVWTIDTGGTDVRDAVSVGDGVATLTTFSADPDGDGPGRLQHFTGRIRSGASDAPFAAGFLGTYGYVEARIKFANEVGTSSSFSTSSPSVYDTGGSPLGDPAAAGTDVQIAEHTPGPDGNTVVVGNHWNGFAASGVADTRQVDNPGRKALDDDFHDYGVLWTPEGYTIYLDRVEVWRSRDAVSDRSQYLTIGSRLVAGVPEDGYGSREDSTNHLIIDAVKVWQRPISAIADQMTAVNTPVAVPFYVTDHFSSSDPAVAEPRSVTVTATSSDQGLLADDHIVVTGNGPADPDGSFANGSFDSGADGWNLIDAASPASGSLHLEQAGGRAEQAVTGLQPNTRYMLGGSYNLERDLDSVAAIDVGVVDADVTRPGDQEVRLHRERSEWDENWAEEWVDDYLVFTTGPSTTEVTVFVDNRAYRVLDPRASNLSIDDLYLEPLISPRRTITLRPRDNGTGPAWVTLTAQDGAGQPLLDAQGQPAQETFVLTVNANSSFVNGGFESLPLGEGWDIHGGAGVVVEDPFETERALVLGRPASSKVERSAHTAVQHVTGLTPNSSYVLSVTGRVSSRDGDVRFGVANQGTHLVQNAITSTDWSTETLAFRTGPSSTTADIVLWDWKTPGRWGVVDNVQLAPGTSVPQANAAPALSALGEQHLVAGVPVALAFSAPELPVEVAVESSNHELLPDTDVRVGGSGAERVLTIAPAPGRTGLANVRIFTDEARTSWWDIPVVVSDPRLYNPDFEQADLRWRLSSRSTVQGTEGGRTGPGVVRPSGSGPVRQTIDDLEWDTTYVLGGWGRLGATLQVGQGDQPAVRFDGAQWTRQQVVFTTPPNPCPRCRRHDPSDFSKTRLASVQVALDGVGYVDDLYLFHGPALSAVADLSLHQGQAEPAWSTPRLAVGGVNEDAYLDSSTVVESSNPEVLPLANLRLWHPEPVWPHQWALDLAAGHTTGRSDVTVRVTDPNTGAATTRTFAVTVNAGDSFNNGDFQRGLTGWVDVDHSDRTLVDRRPASQPPRDPDKVLRISGGEVGLKVTGLVPGTEYVLQGSARGDGSQLQVRSGEPDGRVIGSVGISAPQAWAPTRDLRFRTGDAETTVWIVVADDHSDEPDRRPNEAPCVNYRAGETCLDDLGLFLG